MNIKILVCISLFSQSLFSSLLPDVEVHEVQGVPVQVVYRVEAEPDANGIQIDTFSQADQGHTESALRRVEEERIDLVDAVSVTAEVDYQSNVIYLTIEYPNSCASVETIELE